jgi:hypothetical protein
MRHVTCLIVFSSYQEAQSTEKILAVSHFHCFCITHCKDDAAMPASPPPPAMAPPLQRPLSALAVALPATAAAPLPSQRWLELPRRSSLGLGCSVRWAPVPPLIAAAATRRCHRRRPSHMTRVFSWVSPKKVPIADTSDSAVALAVGNGRQRGRGGEGLTGARPPPLGVEPP